MPIRRFQPRWKGKDNPSESKPMIDSVNMADLHLPAKADFAFVQHMIYQMAENATMAVVLPHGVLFRGAAEEKIRKYIIKEQNYLDAVIGLPANLFYGTGIPACILVLKKCRVHDDNILFINASQHFEKVGNQNRLTDEHVEKIIDTYQRRQTVERYAYVASISEVVDNDYNLNIPRYVDTFEEEESIDIGAVVKDLKTLEMDMRKTDETIAGYCTELGIDSPF